VCGIDNLAMDSLTLEFAKFADYVPGTSAGVTFTLAEGCLAFEGLTAEHNQPATVQLTGYSQGVDEDAADYSASATLTSDGVLAEQYTLGPAEWNATSYAARRFSLETGLTVNQEGDSGHVWPQAVFVSRREPVARVTLYDTDYYVQGEAETNAELWLRNMSEGSTREADDAAEHISFTFPACVVTRDSTGGSFGASADGKVSIHPVKSGANDVVVIDTAAAIEVA
jgi:hypothetical protein